MCRDFQSLDIRKTLRCDKVLEIEEEHISVAIAIVSSMVRLRRETRKFSDLEISLMQLEIQPLVAIENIQSTMKTLAAAA